MTSTNTTFLRPRPIVDIPKNVKRPKIQFTSIHDIVVDRMNKTKKRRGTLYKLQKNIAGIKAYCKSQNQDWVIIIAGLEGAGKSNLGIHVAVKFDRKFDMYKQMIYTFNEEASYLDFIKNYRNTPYATCLMDEAVTVLFSRDHASGEVKDAIKIFNMNRQLNHFSIIIAPSFWNLDLDIRERRARTLLYVFQNKTTYKRYYAWYDKKQMIAISQSDTARKEFSSPAVFLSHFVPKFIEAFPLMPRKYRPIYNRFKRDNFDDFVDVISNKYK